MLVRKSSKKECRSDDEIVINSNKTSEKIEEENNSSKFKQLSNSNIRVNYQMENFGKRREMSHRHSGGKKVLSHTAGKERKKTEIDEKVNLINFIVTL